MPQPKYRIIPVWDELGSEWITEKPVTRNGVAGKDILVELDPDAEFTHTYIEQVLNQDTGEYEDVEKTKTDWIERQTIFVPSNGNKAQLLSNAAWHHYNELNARFGTPAEEIPDPPAPQEYNALPPSP